MSVIVLMFDHKELAMVVLAAVIHESGHLAAIKLLGGTVDRVIIGAGGLEIKYHQQVRSYFDDGVIAVSGPLVNILTALLTVREVSSFFSGINLLFGVVNLLPVSVLDGGRLLKSVAASLWDWDAAEKLEKVCDTIVFLMLFGLSLYGYISTKGNLNVGICTILLVHTCCKHRKKRVEYIG